jgi:hypothetical protein
MPRRELPELLDERLLEGPVAVRRGLGPSLFALMVRDEPADVIRAIANCCQRWGGASDALIPMDPAATAIPQPWALLVDGAIPVHLYTGADGDGLRRIGSDDVHPGEPWVAEPLLSVLAGHARGGDQRPRVTAALPAEDNEWFDAYLSALGTWPDAPEPKLLEQGSLREDLGFDAIVDLTREPVADPSGEDLLRRLRDATASPPARAATWLLAPRTSPSRTSLELELPWGAVGSLDRAVASNIVVVYTPGNVADLCLLWNLRAAHGLPDGLPLGMPVGANAVAVVNEWIREFAYQPIGLGETRFAVVSTSVSPEDLGDLAARLGRNWHVVRPEEVIRPVRPAVRPSTDVAIFERGVASVAASAPADRDLLIGRPSRWGTFELTARFELLNRTLPPIRSLRHDYNTSGFAAGGFETSPRRIDEIVEIEWPSGWLVLEAAVRDRGLVAKPSRPGIAAAALLRSLGSLQEFEWLADRPLLDRLYTLGERRGISWFRRRAADLAAQSAASDEDDRLAAIERRLAHFTARPFENEQHDATFADLKADLGDRQVAREWLRWAERSGLLLRGGQVGCDNCGLVAWRAIGELGPGLICRGCAQPLVDPFGEENLTFRYRASELLLTAIETDSLPHLFALRWLAGTFERGFGESSNLYGGYPGVEILDVEGHGIAEIDVLLLGADGSLVPGEAKRHGSGLRDEDVAKLDRVASLLSSPWSFIATMDWASECPEAWGAFSRRGESARVALSGERLLASYPFIPRGQDRFAWREADEQERAEHHKAFASRIRGRAGWRRATRVPGRLELD